MDSWIIPEWSLKHKEVFWMGLVDRPRVEPQKQGGVPDWIGFYGIGATICIGQESW